MSQTKMLKSVLKKEKQKSEKIKVKIAFEILDFCPSFQSFITDSAFILFLTKQEEIESLCL